MQQLTNYAKSYNILILSFLFITVEAGATDPCESENYGIIDDWKRSVAYGSNNNMTLCDNILTPGWFRITSGAGEKMPTQCPTGGFRCGTERSIYLSRDGLKTSETTFPTNPGQEVDRFAYSANYDGNCKNEKLSIKIKKCKDFLLYHLQPVSTCPSAYCFGDQLPCPDGKSSDTGFGPNCFAFPDIKVMPKASVSADLVQNEQRNQFNLEMVYSKVGFHCNLDSLDNKYTYIFSWFINDELIPQAKTKELTKLEIKNGDNILRYEHWETKYRPNMLVKCGVQIKEVGFKAPTPIKYSEQFFAGIKVEQTNDRQFYVTEGKSTTIPVTITMPVACSWPKNSHLKNAIQSGCMVSLLTGIPHYQKDPKMCNNELKKTSLEFSPQTCGVHFSHTEWIAGKRRKEIEIHGKSDGQINMKNRFTVLRLYNSDNVQPKEDLKVWTNIQLPEIRVQVIDDDQATRGRACRSENDPHMRTFDGKTYELQRRNGQIEGEYILFHHDRLPIQVHAYYRACYSGVLCNCGVAVRSGDSTFVANFCKTTYRSSTRVNRYIVQRLCDDHSLVVTESGNSYTIELPTKATVTFSHGRVDSFYGINGINIVPSILDRGHVTGLCGIYNNDIHDDLTPRNDNQPRDERQFASSWLAKKEESLFGNTLPPPIYLGQEYCTCTTPVEKFPHGEPEYNCGWTVGMEGCRQQKTQTAMVTASCKNQRRRKRSLMNDRYTRSVDEEISDEDEQPPLFEMIDEANVPITLPPESWQNKWTEDTARKHCTDKVTGSPAFGPCSSNVPINATDYIESCVLDIKASGSDVWLKATLQNFGQACKQEAGRTEVLMITNSTNSTGVEKSIFAIIEESTCPDNCSGHGLCVDGTCECYDGYFGDDCNLSKQTLPVLEKDAFVGECDNRLKPCKKFIIPGYDFIRNNLTCKFHPFVIKKNETGASITVEEETFIASGIYRSSFFMLCELPPSRRRRSSSFKILASGYHISISNDGHKFTDNVTMLVVDSLCVKCNISTHKCEELTTCPKKIEKSEKSNSILIICVGIASAVIAAVLFIIIGCVVIKRQSKRNRKIYDSSPSLKDLKH